MKIVKNLFSGLYRCNDNLLYIILLISCFGLLKIIFMNRKNSFLSSNSLWYMLYRILRNSKLQTLLFSNRNYMFKNVGEFTKIMGNKIKKYIFGGKIQKSFKNSLKPQKFIKRSKNQDARGIS